MKPTVPRLHVITDEIFQNRYSHVELATICSGAGADGIQYREKRKLSKDTHKEVAANMYEAVESHGSLLIVNDFVEIATAIHAKAVHLGQEDERVLSARAKLGTSVLIGATANSVGQAIDLDVNEVDYLGVGPVFGTKSKERPAPTMGTTTLANICKAVSKPVVAIGNIQLENVAEVIDAGAHGIAVLSAIVLAPDVGKTTSLFAERIQDTIQ